MCLTPSLITERAPSRRSPAWWAAKGFKKAFIASDPDLVKFNVTKKVTDLLDEAGMAYEIYSDIKPNPTIENVQSGVEAYKKSGADYMITIGGGSSMDTGKAIGIIINNPEFADVRSLEGVAPTKNRTVFTIAVPTTAGTAAEATINYVITDVERKRKFVCVDTNDIPDIAVVDPDMMSTMPKGLTASTGMDALTHAHRGLHHQGRLDPGRLPEPGGHPPHLQEPAQRREQRARRPRGHGPGPVRHRHGLLQRGPGHRPLHGPHPGAVYDTPPRRGLRHDAAHRDGVQPGVQPARSSRPSPRPWAWTPPAWTRPPTARPAIDAVRQLSQDVGIPTKLPAMKEEDLDFLAQSAAADACAPGNPREATVEDFKTLFRKLM